MILVYSKWLSTHGATNRGQHREPSSTEDFPYAAIMHSNRKQIWNMVEAQIKHVLLNKRWDLTSSQRMSEKKALLYLTLNNFIHIYSLHRELFMQHEVPFNGTSLALERP